MGPADQRLVADNLIVDERDHRLVGQMHLAALDSGTHVSFELDALRDCFQHAGRVAADPTAPLTLRLVERDIGELHQFARIARIVRAAQPDATTDQYPDLIDLERGSERFDHPLATAMACS